MRSVAFALCVLLAGLATGGQGPPRGPVRTGVDVLAAGKFSQLAGRRVALLTNQAARTGTGELTLDALRRAPGFTLAALFAPEHGLSAAEDEKVASSIDVRSGLQVHSLYGETQRPTAKMLQGLDLIVIDLPDVGARFYTYLTTTGYVLEAAAKAGVAVLILDRPNPINGVAVEGPLLDPDLVSFVGYGSIPIRHGLTLGEFGQLINAEFRIGADLTVLRAEGWRREMWFDDTGLPWTNPSPNIRNLAGATLYPGLGAIEWANVSVGRGTAAPFEQVGAPWIDARRLAAALNSRRIPGVRFTETAFTPDASVFANERCAGVSIEITDRAAVRPVRVGVEIAAALWRQHPDRFDFGRTVQLLGSRDTIRRIQNGEEPAVIAALWTADEARWRDRRAKYLLY